MIAMMDVQKFNVTAGVGHDHSSINTVSSIASTKEVIFYQAFFCLCLCVLSTLMSPAVPGGPEQWHSLLYVLTSSDINRFSKLFNVL